MPWYALLNASSDIPNKRIECRMMFTSKRRRDRSPLLKGAENPLCEGAATQESCCEHFVRDEIGDGLRLARRKLQDALRLGLLERCSAYRNGVVHEEIEAVTQDKDALLLAGWRNYKRKPLPGLLARLKDNGVRRMTNQMRQSANQIRPSPSPFLFWWNGLDLV